VTHGVEIAGSKFGGLCVTAGIIGIDVTENSQEVKASS